MNTYKVWLYCHCPDTILIVSLAWLLMRRIFKLYSFLSIPKIINFFQSSTFQQVPMWTDEYIPSHTDYLFIFFFYFIDNYNCVTEHMSTGCLGAYFLISQITDHFVNHIVCRLWKKRLTMIRIIVFSRVMEAPFN